MKKLGTGSAQTDGAGEVNADPEAGNSAGREDLEKTLADGLGDGGDAGTDGENGEGDGAGAEGGDAGTDGENAEGDGAGAEGGDAEGGELPEGSIKDGEIPGLKPEIQASVNQRIGKVVARQKAAEEKAAEAEAKVTQLQEQRDAVDRAEAFKLGLHPEYLSKDEVEVMKKDSSLAAAEKWLLENFDGYEGDGTAENPKYTAGQVRMRYAEVKEERAILGSQAAAIRGRAMKELLEDLKAGRQLRLSKAAQAKKFTQTVKKTVVKPPAVPSGANASGKPPVSVTNKGKADFAKTFDEKGQNKEALESAYESLF
jgi:hypothetical protein